MFDPNDPTKLIAMTKTPLLVPETPYETGDLEHLWVDNTVFPCGAIPVNDGKTLRIYYGAGDYSTNIAEIDFADILREMTPCTRMAERATIPFKLEDWKKGK